ncbi:hypothetical protein Drorol1_Dr00025786, partial [Drosera rotundifolia]
MVIEGRRSICWCWVLWSIGVDWCGAAATTAANKGILVLVDEGWLMVVLDSQVGEKEYRDPEVGVLRPAVPCGRRWAVASGGCARRETVPDGSCGRRGAVASRGCARRELWPTEGC